MGQHVIHTTFNTDGKTASGTNNADGCIVPTKALGEATCVLTPLGLDLLKLYASNEPTLHRILKAPLMQQLANKLVASPEEKAKQTNEAKSEDADNYGLKKLSTGIPCACCAGSTRFTWTFGIEDGRAYPYCNNKPKCKTARNKRAIKLRARAAVEEEEEVEEEVEEIVVAKKAAPSTKKPIKATVIKAVTEATVNKAVAEATVFKKSKKPVDNAAVFATINDEQLDALIEKHAGNANVTKKLNAEKLKREVRSAPEDDLLALSVAGNDEESEAADAEITRRNELGTLGIEIEA